MACLVGCGKYDDTSLDVTKIDVDKYVTDVGNYTGLTIQTEAKMDVTDENVDEYINYLLASMGGEPEVVDRPIQLGDVANIDYQGFKDGVAFDGGTAAGYDLNIGSGTFINGFEDGLVGYSAGEEVELNLTFPENYGNADLAGQAVVFKVTVNSVSKIVPPELTDELVAEMGFDGVNTVAEFRAYVTDSFEKSAENSYENTLRDRVLKQIYSGTTFATQDVPANLYNYYISQVQSTDQNRADQYGVTLQQYVSGFYGMEYEEYISNIEAQAKEMTQDALICEKIARMEKISVTDKEIQESKQNDVEKYGYSSVEEFDSVVDELDYKNYLIEIKVVDLILESANVVGIEE